MSYALIKASKHLKNDTVFIGDSGAFMMFNFFTNYFNKVFFSNLSWKQSYNLIRCYLDAHPETKNMIYYVNYTSVIEKQFKQLSEYSGKNFTIDDYVKLFLSFETTQKSINILRLTGLQNINQIFDRFISDMNNRFRSDKEVSEIFNEEVFLSEKLNPDLVALNCRARQSARLEIEDRISIRNENLEYLKKILNLLEEKNINIVFLFPPYNAVYLAFINKNISTKQAIEMLKKEIVRESENVKNINIDIYDMAFVNKYTSIDVTLGTPYYYNFNHPNLLFGAEFLKILYNKGNEDKSIYFKLNKDNINDIINKENELLAEYTNKNEELINEFESYTLVNEKENIKYNKSYLIRDLNKDMYEKYKYIKKIEAEYYKNL